MTYIPVFLPKMTNNDPLARCALFVAFEGMGLLDLTGPLTVFRSASKFQGTAAPARLGSQPGRCAERPLRARSCHTTTDKVQRVLRFPSRNSVDRILVSASPKQAAFGNKQRRVQPSITLRPCIETYRQTHVLVTPFCRLI